MRDETSAEILLTATTLRRGVHRFVRRLRAERSAHDLSGSKRSILGLLFHEGPLTASDLAAAERVQPQSLTRLIAELEASGLIARRPDDLDRRQLWIEITQSGQELLASDARRQDSWLASVLVSRLTPVEQKVLSLAAELISLLAKADSLPAAEVEK